jgi:hypothetical protein
MRKTITLTVASLALLALTTPSFAVSESTAKRCEAKAEKKRPALTAAEKEAYIANCKANAS